jgi:hypothetical protein
MLMRRKCGSPNLGAIFCYITTKMAELEQEITLFGDSRIKKRHPKCTTWMTSFSSVQYTSSGAPRTFPQVKKQVLLGKDARSSDVLHFVCFGEETWNCMHFLVILSLKTLWAGVKRWRTALHRFFFFVYRNTYFISCDSKMCSFLSEADEMQYIGTPRVFPQVNLVFLLGKRREEIRMMCIAH